MSFKRRFAGVAMRLNRLPFVTVIVLGTFSLFYLYNNLYPGDAFFLPLPTVVNQLDFETVIEPTKCSKTKGIDLLVFILSIYKNDHKRQTIRATWGSVTKTGDWPSRDVKYSVKIVFLLGYYDSPSINEQIKHEAETFGDILQIKCVDSYDMPTSKILTGFKWMDHSCSNVAYVLKSDDDVFLNVPGVMDILQGERGSYMYGDRLRISGTQRSGKHSVSFKAYPFILYPPYLIGYTYFMPYSVAKNVFKASYYVPQYSKYEDVYIAGMLAKATNTELKQLQPSWISLNKNVQLCDFVRTKLVAAADLDIKMISNYWQTFINASICKRH